MAVTAIDRKDARGLLRLAHPDEVRRLNLTEAAVRGLLADTYWRNGPPTLSRIPLERLPQTPADQATFVSQDDMAFGMWITDSRTHGWRLNLSFLFFSFCKRAQGRESAARLEYAALCRRYGVAGLHDPLAVFHPVERIEARARELAAEGR